MLCLVYAVHVRVCHAGALMCVSARRSAQASPAKALRSRPPSRRSAPRSTAPSTSTPPAAARPTGTALHLLLPCRAFCSVAMMRLLFGCPLHGATHRTCVCQPPPLRCAPDKNRPTRVNRYYYSPWRAPGAAPVFDSCGMAGGHKPPDGGFGETLPFPCVSTALVVKTVPFLAVLLRWDLCEHLPRQARRRWLGRSAQAPDRRRVVRRRVVRSDLVTCEFHEQFALLLLLKLD